MGDPADAPTPRPAAVVPCPTDPGPGKLVCVTCRRTVDCPPADLAGYMKSRGWPGCCSQVMAFYVPAGKPWEPVPSTPRERTLAGVVEPVAGEVRPSPGPRTAEPHSLPGAPGPDEGGERMGVRRLDQEVVEPGPHGSVPYRVVPVAG